MSMVMSNFIVIQSLYDNDVILYMHVYKQCTGVILNVPTEDIAMKNILLYSRAQHYAMCVPSLP